VVARPATAEACLCFVLLSSSIQTTFMLTRFGN
jgi:hypothetical protein